MRSWRQLYVVEVLTGAVVGYAMYGIGSYQAIRIYFLWISVSKLKPVEHRFLIASCIFLIMQWMIRLPANLLRVLYRSGKITFSDFEPWRAVFENDALIVIAGLVALPAGLVVYFDTWEGEFLLFLLPLLIVILTRTFLRLPEPTDKRNRMDVDRPLH